MSRTDLTSLAAKARAATPGPWKIGDDGSILPADGRKGYIAAARVGPFGERYIHGERHDLAYIAAASPDVVLSLIDRIRELEAGLRDALAALDYDLRDLPERECDRRIWEANMRAHKVLTALAASTPSGTERK